MNIDLSYCGNFTIIRDYYYITMYNYDSKVIYFRHVNMYEYWTEYDSNNNKIHYKNSFGYEKWIQYDNKMMVHKKEIYR